MNKKLFVILKNPLKLIRLLGSRGLFNWIPDRAYLKLIYFCETRKKLNLFNPTRFNEKLQWLKLNDRQSEYNVLVDKYAVRDHIKNLIGEQYLIPLINVFNHVDEIDWSTLPHQFVLKCTHGSHCNIICTDKSKLNINEAKQKLSRWMQQSWYWFGREWVYKNVTPRIICEQYMGSLDNVPNDYKIMCFGGVPKIVQVHRKTISGEHSIDFYGTDGKLLPIRKKGFNNSSIENLDINQFKEMLDLARILSEGKIYLRTDFYMVHERIFFGELTFFDSSGFIDFEPEESNVYLGSLIDL